MIPTNINGRRSSAKEGRLSSPGASSKSCFFNGSDTSFTASSTVSRETLPLNFAKLDLTGRKHKRHCETLRQALARLQTTPEAPSELLLVQGRSGVGKTHLIRHSLEETKNDKGFFCSSKFDQYENVNVSRPYGVVNDVVTELCTQLQVRPDLESFQQRLTESLVVEDRNLLLGFIPAMSTILGEKDEHTSTNGEELNETNEFAFRRFALVLRSFFNAIATQHTPVVLFFDDMQWGDTRTGSRELIENLASGKTTNLLLVLAVRLDEERIFEIQTMAMNRTVVTVEPHDESDVNELLVSLLDPHNPQDTIALSQLVHQRTKGNIYFVLQFLELLHRDKLLDFDYMSCRWTWDLDKIQDMTLVSENVASLLAGKILTLPLNVQRILIIAACLGFSFAVETLRDIALFHSDIWQEMDNMDIDDSNKSGKDAGGENSMIRLSLQESDALLERFDADIAMAEKQGLIERAVTGMYRFSHDRVQQSLASMLPPGQTGVNIYRRLGEVVRDSYRSCGDERKLFTAVDLLEKGRVWEQGSHEAADQFAGFCSEAALAASEKSAFASAGNYADVALRVLHSDEQGWAKHYGKCLDLATLSAKMHFSYGNLNRGRKCTDDIIEHAKCPEDAFQARYIRLGLLAATGKDGLIAAYRDGVLLCRELGLSMKMKPSKFDIIFLVLKTKRILKKRKAEHLWGLPTMTDPSMLQIMRILYKVIFYAYMCAAQEELKYGNTLMMYLTLVHGISPYAPVALTAYGGVLSFFRDFQGAFEFGALALEMTKRPEFRVSAPLAILVGHCFLNHLKMPFQNSLKPTLRAYRIGLELGQTEFAALALRIHTCLALLIGMPLQSLGEQVNEYCDWFREYNHTSILYIVVPWAQVTENMLGHAKDPLKLTGRAMDEDKLMEEFDRTGNMYALHCFRQARLFLYYVFGDYTAAETERVACDRAESAGQQGGTHLMKTFSTFFAGLTCMANARMQPKKRFYYKRKARRYMQEIQKYVRGGSVNGVPLLKLLQAELLGCHVTSGGKHDESALKAYQEAINMAGRCGFLLVKCLASERAGEYLMRCGNQTLAEGYLMDAYTNYAEYGASQKLVALENEYEFVEFTATDARSSVAMALKAFIPDRKKLLVTDTTGNSSRLL